MNLCEPCLRHLAPGRVHGDQLLPLAGVLHTLRPAPGGPVRFTRCGMVVELTRSLDWQIREER